MPSPVRRTGIGRDKLLAAARQVISEYGVEGLRVRRIAAAAGVSPPLVSYHYPDPGSLVVRVHRELVLDYMSYRERMVRQASGAVDKLRACVRAGLPPEVDPELIAPLFELHGLARRNAEHASLLADLWISEHQLYVQILAEGVREGVFVPERPVTDIAAALLALEDGPALHLNGKNPMLTGSWALDTLLHLAAGELHCAELEPAEKTGSFSER